MINQENKSLFSDSEMKKVPFSQIVDKYSTYFFDCDGVIWKGLNYLPAAFKALNKLKELNKNVFFITNFSAAKRVEIQQKIKAGGFDADISQIYTSSILTAKIIKTYHPDVKTVYLIGSAGLKYELEQVGLKVVGGDEDNNKTISKETFDDMIPDPQVDAVVVGIDCNYNYYKLCYASVLTLWVHPSIFIKYKN